MSEINKQAPVHHPRLQLDDAIHQPVRLSILSILSHSQKVDFAFLRNYLELGESNLSRHLTALEELSYIQIEKVFEKKKPRTWLSLTEQGRNAFDNYLKVLQQIVRNPMSGVEAEID